MSLIVEVVRQCGMFLFRLLPYVAAGALFSAFLQRRKMVVYLDRVKSWPPVPLCLSCAVLGVLSPFCTFGTVPVVIGLIGGGLPVGGGIAFLASSSIANPQLLLIQYASLGPTLTIFQGLSAVVIGLFAGRLAEALEKRGIRVVNPVLPKTEVAAPSNSCRSSLFRNFLNQLDFLLPYLIVGTIISAIFTVCLPDTLLAGLTGNLSAWAVFAGAALSVPTYVCGGSVMPVLSSLLDKGCPPGPVLAFLIAGPTTRIAVLAALKSILNRRGILGYLGLILFFAVVMGLLLNGLWVSGGLRIADFR